MNNRRPSSSKPAKIGYKTNKEPKYSPPSPLTKPPNPKSSKNVLPIGGLQVEFPYQPYGTQLAFMNRVISTLDRAQRDGHCHALLESPTGTGKSLSLLCSTLAWQQTFKSKNLHSNLARSNSTPNPEAITDPINCGGGFIPETQPLSGNADSVDVNSKKKKNSLVPTIFYASRTHSQIRQVIQEYRKTTYRVPMAILASRKHYCTNAYLRGTATVDEQCKLLLKDKEIGCSEFKNVHKVICHPSLQKGGCHEAHDIEDLVKVGEVVKGCSYFAARAMVENAELVFCPYNYIINPIIRRAMEIDIKGAIIILDEAHNIEDVARDAGSFDVEEDVLLQLQTELEQLTLTDALTYQPLLEMIQGIFGWIDQKKSTLEKREFQHYYSCWTGTKALTELEEANITRKGFPILQECVTKAIKATSDTEPVPEVACLSGVSATVLEGLFSSLSYFFSGDGLHVNDYLLALRRYIKKDGVNSAGGWTHALSLWCLHPAVVFRGIADISLSVILTSGTLSPMHSFSSELGIQFGTCMEAPHVIDTESQLWAGVISKGPQNYPLNASYRTAEAYAFQDALGTSLEEICKTVPGGCLVFFPSYKLMDKLCRRWEETGQWSRLNAHKSLFIEPRGGNQESLVPVLQGYYNSIHQKENPVIGRKRRGKKPEVINCESTVSSQTVKREGAAFLAVCRGKISEGIDFSDDNARVVIVVGIPFPNIHDILVAQKKKFNDMYRLSKSLQSGSEWYCHQAFRALNQATGRCIRHRYDYGAIIYLDERFCEERNRSYISKWFRRSIKQCDSFENSLEDLKAFFRAAKDHVDKAGKSSQISDIEVEEISSAVEIKGISTKKNQKESWPRQRVPNCSLESENAYTLYQSLHSEVKYESFPSQKVSDAEGLISTNERDISDCREYIDLDSDTDKDSRWSLRASKMLSLGDPNLTIVKETPDLISGDNFFNDNSSLTVIPSSSDLRDNYSHSPVSLVNSGPALNSIYSVATPERIIKDRVISAIPEMGSPCNLSANSCSHKRRKSLCSPSDCLQKEQFGLSVDRTPDSVGFTASIIPEADVQNSKGTDSEINNLNMEKRAFPQSLSFNNAKTLPMYSSGLVMDKRLQIFCSVCKNPLGLPEYNFCVACTLTSSSKVHLRSLQKEKMEHEDVCSPSLKVLISDISSLDKRLFERSNEAVLGGGEGVWCKADGCVFNTIFCPFCSDSTTCLGVQVMATDSSNAYLQDKVLLYSDLLETKTPTTWKLEDSSPSTTGSCSSRIAVAVAGVSSIEKFAYSPQQQQQQQQQSLGEWRTTKSKMRLPKKRGQQLSSTPKS